MIANTPSKAELNLSELAQRAPDNAVDAAMRLLETIVESRGKAAFAARALDALTELTKQSDEGTLIDAAGAPTNFAVLVQALDNPEALAEIRRHDPLGPARLRGLRAQDWILNAEGGTLSAVQIGDALRLSRQAVDKRRKQGTLIGLDLGRRGYAYPAWQVGPRGMLAGLPTVLAELRTESPWAQAAFFLTPNDWLDGETPLSSLRRGEIERVENAARYLGDHIAV